MRKRCLLFFSLALLFCFGCGSSSKYAYDAMTTTESKAMAPAINDYFSGSYEEIAVEEGESASYFEASDRKLIKTVHLSAETENFDEFIVNITTKINEVGGYAEEFGQNGHYSYRYANITARIPKQKLDEFLKLVEGESNIISKSESVEDVTLQYVDLTSHKTALIAEEKRLLELLEKAENVSDIIVIEEKLADTRYRLDSMESQIRTYDNKVDFVTVYLSIDEVVRYTPTEELTTWGRIKTGFTENLYNLGQAITDIFVWFVVYIPNIIIVAVVVIVVIIIIKKIRSRKTKKKDKKEKTDDKCEK